jgi:hypothetical protein
LVEHRPLGVVALVDAVRLARAAAVAEVLPAQQQDGVSQGKPRRKKQQKPSRIGAVLSSAVTWLFGCAFIGAAVTVAGVSILAGAGWALIAVGVFLFLIAGLIHVGISHG